MYMEAETCRWRPRRLDGDRDIKMERTTSRWRPRNVDGDRHL